MSLFETWMHVNIRARFLFLPPFLLFISLASPFFPISCKEYDHFVSEEQQNSQIYFILYLIEHATT